MWGAKNSSTAAFLFSHLHALSEPVAADASPDGEALSALVGGQAAPTNSADRQRDQQRAERFRQLSLFVGFSRCLPVVDVHDTCLVI